MTANSISREIVIKASPETVYDVVSRPEHITKWFSDKARFEPSPESRGVFVFTEADRTTTVEMTVVTADRPHLFAFSWVSANREQEAPADAVLVEFRITTEPGGTRLVISESGLDEIAWDDTAKAAYADEHGNGWEHVVLPRLRAYAERLVAQSSS